MRTAESMRRAAGRRPTLPQRHRARWVLLVVLLALIAAGIAVAALGRTFVGLADGTPALATLQGRGVAETTLVYDAHGHVIARLHGAIDRIVVASARIPTTLKQATVAVEDKRFYEHHGVDFRAIARAALIDLETGRPVQGASTITEQYVKNAYLRRRRHAARARCRRRSSPGSSRTAGPRTASSPPT